MSPARLARKRITGRIPASGLPESAASYWTFRPVERAIPESEAAEASDDEFSYFPMV